MKEEFKILHIWNTAGIPQTLAKFQRKLGYKSDVLMRSTFTSFGADKALDKPIIISGRAKKFALACLWYVMKYDVIHAHAFPFSSQYIHRLIRWKPFVYHMHGTWIRGKWNKKDRVKYLKKADFLVVATPELLEGSPSNAVYIPNPVDTTHFIRTESYISNTALYMLRWKRQLPALEQAKRECKEHGLELTVVDRQTSHIPYQDFPGYLQKFEYYMDTKAFEVFDPLLRDTDWDIPHSEVKMNSSLSVTALQQLALGGKVINDGEMLDTFPQQHNPEIIAKQWIKIYERMINGG